MAEYIERMPNCNECIHNGVCGLQERCIDIELQLKEFGCDDFKATADVAEVRHARFKWGYQNGQYGIWCTGCGAGWVDRGNAEWIALEHDYCPKCGAKMDGKGEGE